MIVAITSAAQGAAGNPVSNGESGKEVGPVTAAVDPAYSTPGAARSTVHAAHQHHGGKASQEPGTSTSRATLDPAVFGEWSTLSYQLPVRAIHATLLRNGKFLLIAGSGNSLNENIIANFKAYLWDPATATMTSVPAPWDAFCSGHLVDANGDVLVFGGTIKYSRDGGSWTGSNKVYKFVVDTGSWVAMPNMRQGRWYPTVVMDGRNRYLAYSGQDAAGATPSTPERYDPVTNAWTTLSSRTLPLYPSLHLLKDGRIAYTGAYYGWTNRTTKPVIFSPTSTSRVQVSDPSGLHDSTHRNAAMSALVGSADRQLAWVAGGGFPAVRSSYFIDLNVSTPRIVAGPALPVAKGYVSISHLPDLTALETGGGGGTNSPVYEASILNPGTRRLAAVAPPSVPRTYHSSSVTMPDGRVVTFGGDPSGDSTFEVRIEIFSPPYLFKGTRPTVESAPTEVTYGGAYLVGASASDATLTSAVLMRPGSATHSLDANQRVLQLTTTPVADGVTVTLPTNTNLAPPGWYLLFINDSRGRPSIARWIHLT